MRSLPSTSTRFIFLEILACSLLLRISTIGYYLPDHYFHDDLNFISTSLRFGSGSFQPGSFLHGTLFPEILFLVNGAYFAIGRIIGLFQSGSDFYTQFIIDPTNLFLLGRLTNVFFGTFSIILVYKIGRSLYSKFVGLAASLLLGLNTHHILSSQGVKEDILLTFLMIVTFLCASNILQGRGRLRDYCFAGLAVGAGIAVKYSGVVGIVLIVVAHLFYQDKSRLIARFFDKRLVAAAICVVLGLFIAMPQIINYENVLNGITVILGNLGTTNNFLGVFDRNTMALIFSNHMKELLGLPLEFVAILGIIDVIYRKDKKGILTISYPLVLILISARMSWIKTNHLLSIVPFFCLSSVAVLELWMSRFFKKRILPLAGIVCVIILLAPSVIYTAKLQKFFSLPETRRLSREWIEATVKQDSKILIEGSIIYDIIYCPQLKSNKATFMRELNEIRERGETGRAWALMVERLEKPTPGPRYDIYKVAAIDQNILNAVDPEYVITTSFVMPLYKDCYLIRDNIACSAKRKEKEELFKFLDAQYDLIRQFLPTLTEGKLSPGPLIEDFRVVRQSRLFFRKSQPIAGPEIRIYRRRPS